MAAGESPGMTRGRDTPFVSSRAGLLLILLIKLAATVFTVYIYMPLTRFGDAYNFLLGAVPVELTSLRTHLTQLVFGGIYTMLPSELAVASLVSGASGFAVWWCIRPFAAYITTRLFWLAFLLPHFLIWSGYISKESLSILCFMVWARFAINMMDPGRQRYWTFLPFVIGAVMIRPHFAVAYAWLTIIAFVIYRMRGTATNSVIRHSGFLLAGLVSLIIIGFYYDAIAELLRVTAATSEQYFVRYRTGQSSRYWVGMSSAADFFANIWWGLPAAIVGPLPQEVLQRPVFLPILLEGMFSVMLLWICVSRCVRATRGDKEEWDFVVLGLIPAIVIGLLIQYPLGVLNPGAAIRYKQSLAPLMYFLPLMYEARVRRYASAGR